MTHSQSCYKRLHTYLVVQKRTLLGDDMGLGKTVQVLAAMCHLHANGGRHFFVVAPNSVLVNWQREAAKHTELPAYLAHGANREQAVDEWNRKGGIAVTSYSTLPKIAHLLKRIDFLAVDEAHYAKNPEAKRTVAVEMLAKRSTYVSLMTGTALENKVEELHNLLNIASPGAVRELRPMLQANRAFDRAGIAKKIAHVYLRRTQADVLTELPERIEVDEWVTLTEEDRANYDSQPTNIMLKRRSATVTQAKFERLEELLDENQHANTIIVYNYQEELAELKRQYPHAVTLDDKDAIERWNAGKVELLLVHPKSAGHGLNLQHGGCRMVFLSLPWSLELYEQTVGRIHRSGQQHDVWVYVLLTNDTVDEKIWAALHDKRALSDIALEALK